MSAVQLNRLSKHYKILNRREGLRGTFKDLFSRDYRFIRAVDEITMEIAEGEIVGFLGPNGAGKSTAIKMMTGVLEPTCGQILVNGITPYRNRIKNALNIGVVFGQRTQLWWELPVIESFKLLKEIYRLDKRAFEENMGIFNELVNIKSLYSMPVRFLSLGQRMLCDIAAAFLHNPRVIFLDEPTIGLDVAVKSKIRLLIKDLNIRKGTTILLTTHDISDIEALCKRIIIIDKGHIILDGDIQRVKKLFGACRTLKLRFAADKEINLPDIKGNMEARFKENIVIREEEKVEDWMELSVFEEKVELVEVLNYIMNSYPVRDIITEETRTETVIQRIYEGNML